MMKVWGFASSYLDHANNVTLLKLSLVESHGCDRRVASLRSETPKCVTKVKQASWSENCMRTSDKFTIEFFAPWSAVEGSPLVELCFQCAESSCDKFGMDEFGAFATHLLWSLGFILCCGMVLHFVYPCPRQHTCKDMSMR